MKKIIALVLVLLLVATLFAACGKPITPVDATTAPKSTSATEPIVTDPTEPMSEPTLATPSETAQSTTSAATTAMITTTERSTTTAAATTTVKVNEALKDKAAIDLFNSAVKKAVSGKAGFQKHRNGNVSLDLSSFGVLKSFGLEKAINDYLHVSGGQLSDTNRNEAKGSSSNEIKESSLSMTQVKSAKAIPSPDGGYSITLELKDGSTTWSGQGGRTYDPAKDNGDPGKGNPANGLAPLDYGPVYIGDNNNGDYDHKRPQGFYYKINNAGVPGLTVKNIQEETTNASYTAKVDAQGRVTEIKLHYNLQVTISEMKFALTSFSPASGGGSVDIIWSNFSY
jgi:hypothetical protein